MDAKRIIRYVSKIEADAWIVLAGSHDVLEWFAQQPIPAFAFYGRMMDVPIASISPSKLDAMRELVNSLVEMGHRRIVLINREDRRKPEPGIFEQQFLKQLKHHGIQAGSYHLPDWGDDPDDLQKGIESLFRHTPPTAMIVDEVSLCFAVMQQMGRLGLKVPDQVSLACLDHRPAFDWSRPKITHLYWNSTPLVNRLVKWVHNVNLGKEDKRKTIIKAKLVIGGTIGQPPE